MGSMMPLYACRCVYVVCYSGIPRLTLYIHAMHILVVFDGTFIAY